MAEELIPLEPQPLNGKPFRLHFANRGPGWWYNERLGYPRYTNKMLISWKCPFGADGEPIRIGDTWYWKRSEARRP